MEPEHVTHDFVGKALNLLRNESVLLLEDMVVVVAGNFRRNKGVSFVETGLVENLISSEKGN